MLIFLYFNIVSLPPLLGLAQKRYRKMVVKGVMHNHYQEKHIRDLKISGGIGGRRSTEGRYWGDDYNNHRDYIIIIARL